MKIFFGDERTVGPDHPDSNYGMTRNAWLGLGLIPAGQIHRMEGEAEDLEAAASQYEEILRRELPPATSSPVGFPSFDLILLGIGEDGHIASLFPGTRALYETTQAVAVNDVPQHATRRLTLTYPTLNAAREVWFLATGTHKAQCVAQAIGQAQGGWALPASCIRPAGGKICWWLDKGAAAGLTPAR